MFIHSETHEVQIKSITYFFWNDTNTRYTHEYKSYSLVPMFSRVCFL